MTNLSNLYLICFLLIAQFVDLHAQDEQMALSAMWSITSAECLDHVSKLAGDEFKGRATGSAEFRAAAQYIAAQFAEMGLRPAVGDTSFFQRFDISRNLITEGNELNLEVLIKARSGYDTLWVDFDLGKDFLPAGFSSSCEMVSDILFAGYGISSKKNNWDDYEKVDIQNKVVLILNGTPSIEGAEWSGVNRLRHKIDFAAQRGAKAVIGVGGPYGSISTVQNIPTLMVSEKVADDLLKGTGWTLSRLKQEIKKRRKSVSVLLKNRVKIKINSKWTSTCQAMNVVGVLEGNDQELKDEVLIVGAHADHIGQLDKLIFWGANDNASGTATMMEIAEAFSSLETKPRRSIVFMAFTGEEMGLKGSKYYVQNPVFPLQNTRAMINLDMVGSGREGVMVVGGKTYQDFAAIIEHYSDAYIHTPIKLRPMSSNSDHASFNDAGIPSVFLYAMGGEPTWHSVRDVPERVDSEVMETVGRLAFWVLWDLANADSVEFSPVNAD